MSAAAVHSHHPPADEPPWRQASIFEHLELAAGDDSFWAFHRRHPEVYRELVRLARRLLAVQLAKGKRPRWGIAALFETLRYELELKTDAPTYELNNNLRSRYARLIMQRERDLEGFFEVRALGQRKKERSQ